jgi:proteic killer suppression protein
VAAAAVQKISRIGRALFCTQQAELFPAQDKYARMTGTELILGESPAKRNISTLSSGGRSKPRDPQQLDLPGFRLHQLKGALVDYWSITVSAKGRIIFRHFHGHWHFLLETSSCPCHIAIV